MVKNLIRMIDVYFDSVIKGESCHICYSIRILSSFISIIQGTRTRESFLGDQVVSFEIFLSGRCQLGDESWD